MQLFIGGTCAGKRGVVEQRFGSTCWHSAHSGCRLEAWPSVAEPLPLVLEGWERWIAERLVVEPDDDRLRHAMANELDKLCSWEAEQGGEAVLIMLEMGRGIVPLGAEKRRLRDLNGWLAQTAAQRCVQVWYVRNGLAKLLSH
ncbi:adenosylcobinamide kinase [Halomonas sp. DQ26W]|uniref:bifunctional adenosylcobinamide kinase/adenosylcobinamide-phosphate guanylyltransferase n=1 Tax=Halomonas sp. DQ26W TaxID=2282311 RepID=UPI000DF7973D|nr:bifunctional adenosylcobinamide kinase/adenosylcobinamide-phosphate guanylyltransferase [Halomonas sp. DQ26W]RDB43988.1 adenosylcobinamide kinase [Halomonas sp. DQ26W]